MTWQGQLLNQPWAASPEHYWEVHGTYLPIVAVLITVLVILQGLLSGL